MKNKVKNLARRVEREVREGILQYWINNSVDKKNGGFYGRISNEGFVLTEAPKALILNIRILWSFSRAFNYFKKEEYKQMAHRAYTYIIDHFWDKKWGGLFWELDYKGNLKDGRKKVYGQAFGLYAFSEYYKTSGEKAVLKYAGTLFTKIDEHSRDKEYGGYFESFSREWEELEDMRLSDDDLNEKKSNNTHLHLMEAFSTYYQVRKEKVVEDRLKDIIDIMLGRIMDKRTFRFTLFFDETWNKKSNTISYGHEIEAAWLIHEALGSLDDSVFRQTRDEYILRIIHNCHGEYLDGENGLLGMFNERRGSGEVDRDKIWWVQAEACVGFFLGYQLTGKPHYLETVHNIWNFIESSLVDKKDGEWYFYAKDRGTGKKRTTKINEWKSLYHNSRACIELLERIETEGRRGVQFFRGF